MDTTPTRYKYVSEEILAIQKQYNLTDVQTLLYNHIAHGDFKLIDDAGQKFYDKNNNGFGWFGDRQWVKKQFKKLIDNGLVTFESRRDPYGDNRYTTWYFYSSKYDIRDLTDAGCYVTTLQLAFIKHHLKLPNGFDKKNKTYGDIEFIFNDKGYTFKYKGEENIYAWDNNGKGEKQNLIYLTGKSYFTQPIYYNNFGEMVHNIWSFLAHDGYIWYDYLPSNYTDTRQFKL